MTSKKWIEATNAIGIIAKSGRYGGTFAHKDIPFEFASWIYIGFKTDNQKNKLKAKTWQRIKS